MRSVAKTVNLLTRRLEAWQAVVRPDHIHGADLIFQPQSNPEQVWNKELPLSDEYAVKYRTAVGEVLSSRGRLLDLLEVIERCWPHRGAWCERKRQDTRTPAILGESWYRLMRSEVADRLQHELVLSDLHQIVQHPVPREGEDEESIPQLEVLYAYRDAKARLAALKESSSIAIHEEDIDSLAYEARRKVPIHDGRALEWSAKEYIFNERLFLWDDGGLSKSRMHRYRLIFDIAKLTEPVTVEVPGNLRAAVESLEIDEREAMLRILRQIALFVQIFGFDHFVEDVTQEGGQWGPDSGLGSKDRINVIPGGKAGIYHKIVIGLANGGKLQSVMRNIRKHMHQSADKTTTALVITNTWVPSIFRDSFEDVHLLQRDGKKFIFVLVNGRRLVPMDFSFL